LRPVAPHRAGTAVPDPSIGPLVITVMCRRPARADDAFQEYRVGRSAPVTHLLPRSDA
jgi:hypothetical protein